MQSLDLFNATINQDLNISMSNEQDLNIIGSPFQALQFEVMQRASTSRARKAACSNEKRAEVDEIDKEVDRRSKKDVAIELRPIVR